MKNLYFDTDTGELLTEKAAVEGYVEFIKERAKEEGVDYIIENPQEFSMEAWLTYCTTAYNGTLVPVTNSSAFKIEEVKQE